jgi:antitoxin (DNA-binding transcriptional repressor) of toxin-antitoxin stability system
MKTIEMTKATLSLSDYTKDINNEPMIITKDGNPIAALIGISNADLETVSLSNNTQFLALIERSRTRQKTEGGISTEQMHKKLGLLT